MLAFGLFNSFATAGDAGDLERRDARYRSLWSLHRSVPADTTIGKACAKALFALALEAERGRDIELLETRTAEMQRLLDGLEGDDVPSEVMSPDLLHWLTEGEDVQQIDGWDDGVPVLSLQDARLAAVGEGTDSKTQDETNRHVLAKALATAVEAAVEADDAILRDRLLDDLRAIRAAHPGERYPGSRLFVALVSALNHARSLEDQHGVERFLTEVRAVRDEIRNVAV
jgi:hypothetical protein